MILRRVVTDVFSLDLLTLEDQEAVKITDLESTTSVTFSLEEFADLVEVGKAMHYLSEGSKS